MVADNPLLQQNVKGYPMQGEADDLVIVMVDQHLHTVYYNVTGWKIEDWQYCASR